MSDAYRIEYDHGDQTTAFEAPTAEEAVRLYDLFFEEDDDTALDGAREMHNKLKRLQEHEARRYMGGGAY